MCNAQSRPPPWLFRHAPSVVQAWKRAPVFFPLLSFPFIYPIFYSFAYQTTVIPARSDTSTVTMPGSGLPLRFAARRCRSIRLQPRLASRALVVPRERDLEREDEDVKDKARFTKAAELEEEAASRSSLIASAHQLLAPHILPPSFLSPALPSSVTFTLPVVAYP